MINYYIDPGSGFVFPRKMIPRLLLFFALAWPHLATAQGDSRIDLAREWEKNGEYDRAAQELRLHLSEHPEDVNSWQWMGDIRMRAGKFKQASESYRAGLQRDPGNTVLQEKLSLALKKLEGDEMPPMAHELSEVNPAAPEPPKPPVNEPAVMETPKPIATNLEAPKTAPTILETPKASVKKNEVTANPKKDPVRDKSPAKPANIYTLPEYLKALEQYRTGKKEEASQTLRVVLDKFPQHPGAYYLGGVIRYEQGDYEKAEYNFKLGFAFPEKGFNGHYYLGKILQKQGKFSEAMTEYETYRHLTQSEEGRRQADAALSELREKRPKTPEPETAAVVSQPEIAGVPEHAPVKAASEEMSDWAEFKIGNIQRRNGDIDSAVKIYQRVIDNHPDSYWAKQAQWRKYDAVWRKEHSGVLD